MNNRVAPHTIEHIERMTKTHGADVLIACALPYLERSDAVALGALTTGVRAVALRDELLTLSNVAARAWWYRGGWPALVAVRSVDDVATLVRAGVTNVVKVSFCGCEKPAVYACAASHFSATTLELKGVNLSDTTCEHVAKFQRLLALHCSTISCGQLSSLSSCLTVLERLEVEWFQLSSKGVLNNISDLFPALRAFPVLHALPPHGRIVGQSSLLPLSTARLALRFLQHVPRWSPNHDVHAEAVFKAYNDLFIAAANSVDHFSLHCYRLTEDFVHVIEAMASHAATPNSVCQLSKAILIHCESVQDHCTPGTAMMCDVLAAMSVYATTPSSVEQLARTVAQLSRILDFERAMGSTKMCDAIVRMSKSATTLESVALLSTAIAEVTRNKNENKRAFGTAAMCDAIVSMSVYATLPALVDDLSLAIINLSSGSAENQRTFGTVAMRDAIVTMSVFAVTPVSVESICGAICELLVDDAENQRTFCTAAMHDAIVAMAVYATTTTSVARLCSAIFQLSQNHDQNRRTLGTDEMCQAIVTMTDYATTAYSVLAVSLAIIHLLTNVRENQRTFGTVAMRVALLRMAVYAVQPWSASQLSEAMNLILNSPQES